MSEDHDITGWLEEWRAGDVAARDRVFGHMYQALKRMARSALQRHDGHATLQPTALLNEALIKLIEGAAPQLDSREHFSSVVARAMRQILIDRARAHLADKRGAGQSALPLDLAVDIAGTDAVRLIELDNLLAQLWLDDARAAQVVELRVFAGLTIAQTAEVMAVHPSVVNREWAHAREWLHEQLQA
jgi:RNA polymerase sigma factor (TIGR02999 family)